MSRKSSAAGLSVIGLGLGHEPPPPPAHLGETGAALWRAIAGRYRFDGPGGLELLGQACAAADRAEACRRHIDSEGELLSAPAGFRDHPLLKHELAARAFVVRTLSRLGLELEPVRDSVGRPPGVA